MMLLLKIAAVAAAVWAQTGLFGHVRPLGVMPNLLLVTILFFGLYGTATTTLGAAVLGGFLLDLASGTDFGLRTAFFSVVALAVVAARQLGLRPESVVTVVLLTAAGTILFDLAVLSVVKAPVPAGAYLTIAKEALVNIVLAFIVAGARAVVRGHRAVRAEPDNKVWM